MRAVVADGPGEVAIDEVPWPEASAGELVVEVIAAAICSTDRKVASRGNAGPRVLGHEVTGRLDDGTLVGIHPEVVCRRCQACRDGWENRCPSRLSLGIGRDGGLARAVAVPHEQIFPLGGLDPMVSTMLEPLACAVQAVASARIDDGRPTVVVGAGAMGVLCMWVLQASGSPVVVCQRSPQRRRSVLELGADAVIAPEDDPPTHLGEAPGAVVVTAPGAEPMQWALRHVATGGVVQVFAGTPGGADVDINSVHYRHLTMVGSTGSRLQDYERARVLATDGVVALDRLPHRVVKLDDAPDAVLHPPPAGVLKTVVAVR